MRKAKITPEEGDVSSEEYDGSENDDDAGSAGSAGSAGCEGPSRKSVQK